MRAFGRKWWLASYWFRRIAKVCGLALCLGLGVQADDLSPELWSSEANRAIRDASEDRLLALIRGLSDDRGRLVLGEIPMLAAEAGWTNAVQLLLERKFLLAREAPDPERASPLRRNPPEGVRFGNSRSASATDVLAVAARVGNPHLVRLLLDAGADPQGSTRLGFLELSPLLNAMYSSEEAIAWGLKGRTQPFGSWESRRACLDLMLQHGALPTPAGGSGIYAGSSGPIGDIYSLVRLLDPRLLDHVLTNAQPVTQVDQYGRSLLHLAAVAQRPASIEWLIAHGVSIDQRDSAGHSPLELLAASGGVDPLSGPDSKDGFSTQPRPFGPRMRPDLIRSNRLAIASLFLKFGARPNVFTAAGLDDTNLLKQILTANRAELQRTNRMGQTALHVAVQNASVGAVGILLNAGADAGARDAFGSTPMHLAVGWWPNSVLPLLLKAGAPSGTTNASGETPMRIAMRIPEVLQAMIQARPVAQPDVAKRPLLTEAIEAMAGKETLQALFDAGERLEPVGPDGRPWIFWILDQPLVSDSLIFLAQKGLDVQARDALGNTALHAVAGHWDDDVYLNPSEMLKARSRFGNGDSLRRMERVRKRLQARTGRRRPTGEETRPLLDVLLEIGVPVNATNRNGQTLLHLMVKEWVSDKQADFAGRRSGEALEGFLGLLRQLKGKGLVMDVRDQWGTSPLLEAVRNHNYQLARELLQLGCDARATNSFGESALHLLSQGRWLAEDLGAPPELHGLVKDLLAHGLDPGGKNIHGLTAAEEMRWNDGESRLQYYAHAERSAGAQWPLVELIQQLGSPPVTASPWRSTAVPDYSTGAPGELLQILMGPDSARVLERWVEVRPKLDFPAPDGSPLLHWMVNGSLRLDLLPILVQLGLDSKARDSLGRTVLEVQSERLASRITVNTDPALLGRLAAKAPVLNPALNWLRVTTGAHDFVATTNIALGTILEIADAGGAGDAVNAWGQTLLHESATRAPETIQSLIRPGAAMAVRDRRGMTPFLAAAGNRQYGLALAMLAAGADPLATNRLGDTAFHLLGRRPAELQGAVIEPDLERLIGELARRGLNPQQRNRLGNTALEEAREWYQRERSHSINGMDRTPAVIVERWERLEKESGVKGP